MGVCMCSLQVARECGELLPVKVTWGRVVRQKIFFALRAVTGVSRVFGGSVTLVSRGEKAFA